MEVTREQLSEKFKLYDDAEILELYRSGDLTELARDVARAELETRGIDPAAAAPQPAASPSSGDAPAETSQPEIEGDLVMVARLLDPLEAEMVRGRLEAEGIPAIVADGQAAQVLFKLAIGGVRVLVPEAYLERATDIVRADARGEYTIDDRTDVGPPGENP
jgi:hypothetical protein